jgi:hypothetical protein
LTQPRLLACHASCLSLLSHCNTSAL